MPMNLDKALVLLLLSIVVGGAPGVAAAQNTFLNITSSDIIDLIGNATDSVTERVDDSSFPVVNDDDNNDSNMSPSVTTSDPIMINEIELNPTGNDDGKEWIELYNPAEVDTQIGNYEIRTLSKSATIKLPSDAVIEAGNIYMVELDQQMLSNTAESLILADATGNINDRTPFLVDRSDDERTWQRIPDGNNEWQFVENTRDKLNDPDSQGTTYDGTYSGSDVECLGSAVCSEGMAIRVVDADTLYVRVNNTVDKIDLALTKAPSKSEETFIESTAFTRDLCLGSPVLIDQDDKLLASNSSIIAVVYCSSNNLNSELLDNGFAKLDMEQCATSEFANEPWAKDHGC
jgi:endonuclease YncB( thermonuclease family)